MFKILTIALLLIAPVAFAQDSDLLKINSSDYALGNSSAKVKIIEYSSLSCPHCAEFHKDIFDKLKTDYIDKGIVEYALRDFPTNKQALTGSLLAHCKGKERYYTYVKTLMDSQAIWAFHSDFEKSLINIGKLGGISDSDLAACFSNVAKEEFIIKRAADAATTLKIEATPTFFVNGEKHTGTLTYSELKTLIDKAIKK